MLPQRRYPSRFGLGFGLVVALASMFMACQFHVIEKCLPDFDLDQNGEISDLEHVHCSLNTAPVRDLEESDRWTVYEVPGKIRVQHGFGCTQGNVKVAENIVGFRIQDSAAVPLTFGNTGTIILNGWDVQYPNGDHHVKGLSTQIFNITETQNKDQYTLSWEAGGVLSDRNGDDGYKWCYRYTLVFWVQSVNAIDAGALQSPDVDLLFGADTPPNSDTALLNIPGHVTVSEPKFRSLRAVVPRGFGMMWDGTDDNEVLQVGYDLGTPDVDGNTISWISQTILKDDSTVDDYFAAELVTVLSGTSVELWQPPTVLHEMQFPFPPGTVEEETELILSPVKPCGCVGNGLEEHHEFYTVEKVPYEFAIPVLTGWDLQYATEDHHVERIGVYLVEFEYVKDPNAPHGTLKYWIFSTLRDDSDNGHYDPKYQVSVLGFNKLGGGSDKLLPKRLPPRRPSR